MRFIDMLIGVIISILFCFTLNFDSYSVLSNTEKKFSKLSANDSVYSKEAASSISDNRDVQSEDILKPYPVKGQHYIYRNAFPMNRSKRIKGRSKRSRKKKKSKKNKTFRSDFIEYKDDTQSERIMKRMSKMLKEIKENTNSQLVNNIEELSPLQEKKKINSQVNGNIFSVEFYPKTKTFNLVNGQTKIKKENLKAGIITKTEDVEKSKNNIFITKSILDPKTIDSNFTLILTYNKPKNPFLKNKPEFKNLFNAKYIFWRIPKEYRYQNASFHLLLADKKTDSWKEVRIKEMDEIYESLLDMDITGDIPDKSSTLKGKLIMETNGKKYKSDIFDFKENHKKLTRNMHY